MNTLTKIAVIYMVSSVTMAGCHTSKKSTYNADLKSSGKSSSSEIILKAPINSADEKELTKKVYYDDTYMILQQPNERFKDNAPFIELLDSGKRERLWFSSSRADDKFYKFKKTNNYQQIYFCEREVGEGKSPGEGWGDVSLFEVSTKNSYLEGLIQSFNHSTKGAVSIAGNTMIFSSDLIKVGGNSEFKDLWEIKMIDGEFSTPSPVAELSNPDTWESQPTLSQNGKHLFFVSDRKVNPDGKIDNTLTSTDLNIFYSFNNGVKWSDPLAVSELNCENSDVTPQIGYDQATLYFSSNRDGNFQIYEVPLLLDDVTGGYQIDKKEIKPFQRKLFNLASTGQTEVLLNDEYNQQYPFVYFNPRNKKSPRALYWASDNPGGYGSYDIYACDMPFEVQLDATLVDLYPSRKPENIEFPVIELKGYEGKTIEKSNAGFHLYAGLNYQLFGGSTANSEKGTYYCDVDQSNIFIGYSDVVGNDPFDKEKYTKPMSGPEAESNLTRKYGNIPLNNIVCDTTINDTIFITKAWMKKPPCPGKLNIEPTYRSIAYFQTGFWEVNTTDNLKSDLEKLHEGFVVQPGKDIYNPTGMIFRIRSDYKAIGQDDPMFEVNTNDDHRYSIANAPWIELHPNNQYWGDRPGYEAKLIQRMKGRKERIDQYVEYAKKVDENLKDLTDTIKNKYLQLLDLHKDLKPKLLIEIFAVSDKREVTRSWYIGDTIQYRGSEYVESQKRFDTEQVKIVQPEIDEKTKTITRIKPCSIELNKEGDNGSILGISGEKTDLNTNLSRLRAWFGYKEVIDRLTDSEIFNRYLQNGKVALPDNKVDYDDADVIIITRGKREDGDVEDPKNPYPSANNPTGNGFFDYDKIRRIEIQCRLLFEKEKKMEENYCCDPNEK
jgi:hypothetical protein